MENIDAKLKLQHISRIQELESKYSKVYYIPGIAFLLVIACIFATNFIGSPLNNTYIALLLAANIFVTGNASIQRTEYLKQILALKESQ
jgi:amino acid transporter